MMSLAAQRVATGTKLRTSRSAIIVAVKGRCVCQTSRSSCGRYRNACNRSRHVCGRSSSGSLTRVIARKETPISCPLRRPEYGAALHDERYVPNRMHVLARVATHGDEVGIQSLLHG